MLTTIVLIASVFGFLYYLLAWNYKYWESRGVPGPKPKFPFGNFTSFFTGKKHMAYEIDELYRTYKKDEDFIGAFNFASPQLFILNPSLVREILIKDFKNFHDNFISTMVDGNSDKIFAKDPFTLAGEEWKERRALLTPGLTVSRIKAGYPVTNKVCHKMSEFIREQIRMAPKDGIDGKNLGLRFSSEVVTDCVLGIEAGSFTKNPTPILAMIKGLFSFNINMIVYVITVGLIPSLKKFLKCRFIAKKTEDFFEDFMQKAIDLRKSQKDQKDRADFLNYILEIQQKKNLPTMDLTSTSMTFLLDGYETSSNALAHCLLCLGRYPEVQERLRDEIMQHVDKNESLRIFPPVTVSTKVCTEPITLTGKNGRSVNVEKGVPISLPFYSIMADEEYYSNPEIYKPERFLEENGESVKYYREKGLFLGFSDGPRVCIGMRFALTQIKAALVEILQGFEIEVNPKTIKENTFDPKIVFATLKGGIWLDFKSRT